MGTGGIIIYHNNENDNNNNNDNKNNDDDDDNDNDSYNDDDNDNDNDNDNNNMDCILVNPLRDWFFREHETYIFILCHFTTVRWNPSSNKTRTYLFYVVNIMMLMFWRRKEPGHQQPWYWPR